MSVDVSAELVYGWRMDWDGIPDYGEHESEEWFDVFGEGYHGFEPYELVRRQSDYYSDSEVYVGWPLAADCTLPEFNGRLVEAGMHVEEIWRLVMGRELTSEDPAPKLWLYARWW